MRERWSVVAKAAVLSVAGYLGCGFKGWGYSAAYYRRKDWSWEEPAATQRKHWQWNNEYYLLTAVS